MSQTVSILQMLGKLRTKGSYLTRMKVISQLWESFSSLSAKERTRILFELGLEGAGEALEKFLANPGTYYFEILELADAGLKRLSPEQLEKLARGLLSPEECETLLAAARESVQGGNADQGTPPPTPTESEQDHGKDRRTAPEFEAIEPAPDAREITSPVESNRESPILSAILEEREQESVDEEVSGLEGSSLPDKPEIEPPEPSNEKVREAVQDTASTVAPTRPDESGRPGREGAPRIERMDYPVDPVPLSLPIEDTTETGKAVRKAPSFSDSVTGLTGWDRPSAREKFPYRDYRRLTADSSGLKDWSLADLAEHLKEFPEGWMRRRLLTRYIGGLESAPDDRLLRLMRENSCRPADYAWYVAALLRRADLTPEFRKKILESAPNKLLRRRIKRMMAAMHPG